MLKKEVVRGLLNITKKIKEQDEFIRVSIYIMGGFSIVSVGYGIGRLVGMLF